MKLFEYFDKFEKEIIYFSKSLSQNDWEDLIQHAWVKAIKEKYIFENMNFYQTRGWFYKVIRNRFLEGKRKSKKISYFSGIQYNFGVTDNIDTHITRQALLQSLDILDKIDKDIVFSRYFQQKNSTEIGAMLGINPSTVRYRLKKSLSLIKTKLNRSDYYE